MLRLSDVKLHLNHTDEDLSKAITEKLGLADGDLLSFSIFKRSYDARKKTNIFLIYQLDVMLTATAQCRVLGQHNDQSFLALSPDDSYHFVAKNIKNFPQDNQYRPLVIGFGPCGILAALILAQMGFKPIVLERGKDVKSRTRDTWGFWRSGKLNAESNVQYGEGGAGTFSDGKLWSQVKDKRYLGRKVLTEFVKAGAPEEIMYVSKPHIGTFKLVPMVENIRNQIIELGGEVRFETKVDSIIRDTSSLLKSKKGLTDIDIGQIAGIVLDSGEIIKSRHVILAIGHSARDSFKMLLDQGVYIESKPFSIGFRIEHPQKIIDKARFGEHAGHPILGAADYKLVHHCKNGRSVYSFCMCPGGTVVAAASEEGAVVTNGMSQYSRNERNANSAIVVGIDPEKDYPEHPLAGIDLQRQLEILAYQLGGSNYNAPAQLVGDFLQDKPSNALGSVIPSYAPGVTLGDLSRALPSFAIEAIREAIPAFEDKIKGFSMADAVLTGVETRTSSPVCIRRGQDYQNINTRGLYPAGEGAGYAGGILSAGIDGIKVAEAVALDILGAAAI
jgi:uncharacterized protein|tara:strand:- start:9204 stop:10880 length:1677 start_codon:yes stop_codon:yes gene_type:complete